jgi:ABC-2 type transport system permease protein
MSRFFSLTKYLALIHLRERWTLMWNFAFPVFLLILFTSIFGSGNIGAYMAYTLPGLVALNLLSFGVIGSASMISELRTKGVLRRLQASPLPTWQLLGAYLLVQFVVAVAQAALILTIGVVVYGATLTATGVALGLLMMAISLVTVLAIGQLISGVAPSSGAAVAIGQIVYFGQMFIADLVMPIRMMPDWIQTVAPYLPGYAMGELIRPALSEGIVSPELWPNLAVLAVYGIVAGALAVRFFRWEARAR